MLVLAFFMRLSMMFFRLMVRARFAAFVLAFLFFLVHWAFIVRICIACRRAIDGFKFGRLCVSWRCISGDRRSAAQ
jgi:hypothetical protein